MFSVMLPVITLSMKRLMTRLPLHTDTSLMLTKVTVDIFEAVCV